MDIQVLQGLRSNPRLMQLSALRAGGVVDWVDAQSTFPDEWAYKQRIDWLLLGRPLCYCGAQAKAPSKWCGVSCRNKDRGIRSHQSARQTENAPSRMSKRKETTLQRYGVDHISKLQANKNKVRETRAVNDEAKLLQTLSARLGDNPFRDHQFWVDLLSRESVASLRDNFGLNQCTTYSWWQRIGFDWTAYAPMTSSGGERSLAAWLESIDIRVERNVRTLLSPTKQEIDVYLPDYKVGIEYDGLYWHRGKSSIEKQKLAEQNGIRLICVFEDEWIENQAIVKSIIKSKLGLYDTRWYARQLNKTGLSAKQAKAFFGDNHIDGFAVAKQHIGLCDSRGECVAAVSIGASRFKKGERELIRYASKLNTQVVGGLTRLLDGCGEMTSYANKRYSPMGAAYSTIGGGELIGETPPAYYWVKGANRFNRMATQKHKLQAFLGKAINLAETETSIMESNGFFKVYDCGNYKYKLNSH
ncbi:MAG: hypothetical protein DDT26_00320 [Dehalococcoidia bacterium]|nr:hypothetical protein [Chloroflexota bacterium]